MRRLWFVPALVTALTCARAYAGDPEPPLLEEAAPSGNLPPEVVRTGYFDGIGTPLRRWEIRSDTSFGDELVLTERLSVAGAFPIRRTLAAIVRVSAAADFQTDTSFDALHLPLLSIGLRTRRLITPETLSTYTIEFGLRLLPGWSGPNDSDPRTLRLAFLSATNSGTADDAPW